MTYDPLDRDADPFKPPAVPIEVSCLHCGEEYDSYLIEWRVETDADGAQHGFWCCPTPGCSGRGFGFDILPTDPDYRDENGGWVSFDDEDDEDEEDEESWDEDFDESDNAPGDLPPGEGKRNGNGYRSAGEGPIGDDDIPF
jgi:hypothetical protein